MMLHKKEAAFKVKFKFFYNAALDIFGQFFASFPVTLPDLRDSSREAKNCGFCAEASSSSSSKVFLSRINPRVLPLLSIKRIIPFNGKGSFDVSDGLSRITFSSANSFNSDGKTILCTSGASITDLKERSQIDIFLTLKKGDCNKMKSKTLFLGALLMVVLGMMVVGAFGCGQNQPPVNDESADIPMTDDIPMTKTISGEVADFISGNALSGVRIYAGGRTGLSDSLGNYILSNVPLTFESVTFQHGAYTPFTIYTTNEALNVELVWGVFGDIFPVGYTFGDNCTLVGQARDKNGNLLAYAPVYMLHQNYYGSAQADANGSFSIACYLDPAKMPLQVYLQVANSLGAGIKEFEVTNAGVTNVGTLEMSSSAATISGKIEIPYEPFSWGAGNVYWSLMNNDGRFYGHTVDGLSNTGAYSFYLPPTPANTDYYLKVEGRSADYTQLTSKYIENITIASGETQTINFTLPNFITIEALMKNATGTGLTPTFSWTPPDPKFNFYFVLVYEGGSSTYLKWMGITDKTSITYPSFVSGSGFEGLNLNANTWYFWRVYGYYIPNYNLTASQIQAPAILQYNKTDLSAFSVKAMVGQEVKQALEQTMSEKVYFCTGDIPYVTTTTTSTITNTITNTTQGGGAS